MKRPDADALYSDFISALFVALLFSWVHSSIPMIQCVGQYPRTFQLPEMEYKRLSRLQSARMHHSRR